MDLLDHEQGNIEASIFRLKQAQRIAHFGNWELNVQTGIATWSEEACRIYGVKESDNQYTFEDWVKFLDPEEASGIIALLKEAEYEKKNIHFRHKIVRPDGTERQVESHVEFELDEFGDISTMLGVVHDITEIVTIKKELTRAVDNLQLILDLIPLSIYARKVNGDYLFGNHVFLDHYGLSPKDLHGKNLRDFVRSEAEFEELSSQDKLVLASGKKLIVSEFKQTNHEGKMTYWRIIKIPFTPRGQDEKAILGIAEDITQLKKHEEDIMHMAESISARNNELERFSFMVSHELRGPLSTIMGVSELIDHVKLSQDELSIFISGIKSSVTKLDDIITILNDLTVAPYHEQQKKK